MHPERPQTADFRLPRALAPVNVMGRVVDRQGSGRADVMVQLRDDDDLHARESYPEPVETVVTDASGRFSVTAFAGRHYHLAVLRRGRTGPEATVAVQDDARPVITIPLP